MSENIYEMIRGGFRCARGQKKGKQDKTLSRSEFASILKAARSDKRVHGQNAYDLFFICGNFCLRQTEALELSFANFKSIHMGYFRTRTLKSDSDSQEDRVYVGKNGIELVEELVDRRRKFSSEFLFPFSSRTARYLFGFYADVAGISPNVSFHSLRHGAAKAIYDANGNNNRVAEEFLRHKPKSTTDLYLTPSAEEMMRAVDRMGIVR
jgi:integrase